MKGIIALAGTAAMTLAGILSTTAAVSAPAPANHSSSAPRIQTYSPYGWHTKHGQWKIAPTAVYFGGGASYAAPRVKNIHYAFYNHGGAYGTARVYVDNCRPTCVQAGHYVNGRVYFYDTQYHAGPGWNYSEFTEHWQGGTFSAYIDSAGQWNW